LFVGVGEVVTFCSPRSSVCYWLALDENSTRDEDGIYG
jgi:hypothetical protein